MSPITESEQREEAAVQLMILTIDGQQFACIGPVVHMPTLGLTVGNVESIEFGEVMPASMAAQLVCGNLVQEDGLQ